MGNGVGKSFLWVKVGNLSIEVGVFELLYCRLISVRFEFVTALTRDKDKGLFILLCFNGT